MFLWKGLGWLVPTIYVAVSFIVIPAGEKVLGESKVDSHLVSVSVAQIITAIAIWLLVRFLRKYTKSIRYNMHGERVVEADRFLNLPMPHWSPIFIILSVICLFSGLFA